MMWKIICNSMLSRMVPPPALSCFAHGKQPFIMQVSLTGIKIVSQLGEQHTWGNRTFTALLVLDDQLLPTWSYQLVTFGHALLVPVCSGEQVPPKHQAVVCPLTPPTATPPWCCHSSVLVASPGCVRVATTCVFVQMRPRSHEGHWLRSCRDWDLR